MNKRALQNNNYYSPVQQMMASVNNPNLWNINNLIKPPFTSSSTSLLPSSSITNLLAPPNYNNNNINNNININNINNLISHNYHHNHSITNLLQDNQYNMNNNNNNMSTTSSCWLDNNINGVHQIHTNHINQEQVVQPQVHESWSQFLLSGVFIGDEETKLKNWEEQVLLQQNDTSIDHVKQEFSVNSDNNNNNNNHNNNHNNNNSTSIYSNNNDQEFQTKWSPHQISISTSSPQSCVTNNAFNNNHNNNNKNINSMLDFTSSCVSDNNNHNHHNNNLHSRLDNTLVVPDHDFERNCATKGGATKKAKVQPSLSQSTFKVRKEKLGDRITVLHQLVSPFGKTDTASVLLEAIGYIRFLHSQVEALSLPYLSSGAKSERQPYNNNVQEERKCIFPEDPGQLLEENCLKRKRGPDDQDLQEEASKDLRSRGLCLVPLACTMHVGSDNGADYWAPTIGGGFR